MGNVERGSQNLDQQLQQIFTSTARRKDLGPEQSLEYVQFQIAELIGGRKIPHHLHNLLQLHTTQWTTMKSGDLPLLFTSGQEGADTVSVQMADKTICVVPSANPEADKSVAHAVKFAGVVEQKNGKRIVAATYSPYNGQLYNLQISATEEEIRSPVAGINPPYWDLDQETLNAFQGFNQLVWKKDYMMTTPIQQAGVITARMYEQVPHEHFFHIFNPRRMAQQEPFHIVNNSYTQTLGLAVTDNPTENIVTVGQQFDGWEIQIASHLPQADVTLPLANPTFPSGIPPMSGFWAKN